MIRGHERLRRHRWSQSGARYFLTLCTAARRPGLTDSPVAEALRAAVAEIEAARQWCVLAAVIMPDHLHLLIELGELITLSRVVAGFKVRMRPPLQTIGLAWQSNFYEHRLRPDEPVAEIVQYVYLNPYRAGCAAVGEPWPWYWLAPEVAAWFEPETDDGRPWPEWVE